MFAKFMVQEMSSYIQGFDKSRGVFGCSGIYGVIVINRAKLYT